MRPFLLVLFCGGILSVPVSVSAAPAVAASSAPSASTRDVLLALVRANDERIAALLDNPDASQRGPGMFDGSRGLGARVMTCAAAFTSPDSRLHHDTRVVPVMERLAARLRASQLPDGLWDGGNLDSPPDSAFVLKTLAKAQLFLERDAHAATAALRAELKGIILAGAGGLCTGGVHTPNHRWAICSTLAHINALYPDARWVSRVDEWLAEGLDIDSDGQWSERSPNYTSDVNNPGTMEVALLLDRPVLLDAVRRSLEMTIYQVETNGEVETVASRRQDQRAGARKHIWEYYVPYRLLAVRDGNGRFAAMARRIEREFSAELGALAPNMSSPLVSMLEFAEMRADLPADAALSGDFTQVLPHTAMARLRRGATTVTIYGGSDWYAGLGHGSGLATNPTFFKLRKGEAILESVRLTPAFFSTGFFYSRGLTVDEGNRYRLAQTLNVPYHQPLAPADRRADGDYALSADMATEDVLGRYFSKMDFAARPKQFRTLQTTITVIETNGVFELHIDVGGYDNVPVTVELAFRSGGVLEGVVPAASVASVRSGSAATRGGPMAGDDVAGSHLLREGFGRYTVGADTIEFGPGSFAQPPGRMEGETITWVGGSMRAEGERVYLTGRTPFRHTLTIR